MLFQYCIFLANKHLDISLRGMHKITAAIGELIPCTSLNSNTIKLGKEYQ